MSSHVLSPVRLDRARIAQHIREPQKVSRQSPGGRLHQDNLHESFLGLLRPWRPSYCWSGGTSLGPACLQSARRWPIDARDEASFRCSPTDPFRLINATEHRLGADLPPGLPPQTNDRRGEDMSVERGFRGLADAGASIGRRPRSVSPPRCGHFLAETLGINLIMKCSPA
jgi:hypothetical protein